MKKTVRNDIYLERGFTVFTDASAHSEAVVSANYRLLRAIFPESKVKENCTSIFKMFTARTQLSKTEESIINYRFFMNQSYAAISRSTRLSVAQVQRLEAAAIRRLNCLLA